MSQSRCTLSVRGLDCPTEVGDALRCPGRLAGGRAPGLRPDSRAHDRGLRGGPHRPGGIGPAGPRSGRDECGPGRTGPGDGSRSGVLVDPARPVGLDPGIGTGAGRGSGHFLAGHPGRHGSRDQRAAGRGMLCPGGLPRGRMALSSGPAQLESLPARHRRPHGPGDPGGDRPGAMGRGGDRRLPLRAVRDAGVAEPGARSPRDSQVARDGAPDGRADRAGWDHPVRSGRGGPLGRPDSGPFRRHDPDRRRRDQGPFRRRPEVDHRGIGPGQPRARRPGVTPARSTARGPSRSRRPGRSRAP